MTTKLHFPEPFKHAHPPIENVNEIFERKSTFGQLAADRVANVVGSWTFLIVQSIMLSFWIVLNAISWINHWDPYPFILMNLVLSTQAAFTAPVIMMSQNRQSIKDRIDAQNDFIINQKAEVEIRAVLDHLAAHDDALHQIYQLLLETRNAIENDTGVS